MYFALLKRASGNLIRLRNRSKSVDGSIFIDVCEDDFQKNLKIFFHFISFSFFMLFFCSIDFKRQSEHSGLRSDTSSLVGVNFRSESFYVFCSNLVGGNSLN